MFHDRFTMCEHEQFSTVMPGQLSMKELRGLIRLVRLQESDNSSAFPYEDAA